MEPSRVLKHHKFSIADYHVMASAGVLGEDDRVELLEGAVVEMAPIGSRHAAAVGRLDDFLGTAVRGRASVRVQQPIELDDASEPEPDLVLARLRADYYAASHPLPADVLLLIEVGDSSAGIDRGYKLLLYARASVGEVWLVDLKEDTIAVHRDPAGGEYRTVLEARRGGTVSPLAFPDVVLAVDDLIP